MQGLFGIPLKRVFINPASEGQGLFQRLTYTGRYAVGGGSVALFLFWMREQGAHATAELPVNKNRPEKRMVADTPPVTYRSIPTNLQYSPKHTPE